MDIKLTKTERLLLCGGLIGMASLMLQACDIMAKEDGDTRDRICGNWENAYKSLLDMLPTATEKQQMRIIANMERCRWRYDKADMKNGKTVVVNIPEFKLYAYDNGQCEIGRAHV